MIAAERDCLSPRVYDIRLLVTREKKE